MARVYEGRGEPMLTRAAFAARLGWHGAVGLIVVAVALFIGAAGYHATEGLPWLDAVLNAAMLLSGMGPLHNPQTAAGKVFATCYALFSGLAFVALTGLMLAPVMHRVLHRFHLASGKNDES
jgi:hypothetical protein